MFSYLDGNLFIRRITMRGCDAVKLRILNLIKDKNMSINKVCINGNLTTSTLNTMLNNKSEYCSVRTLQKICQGLGISLYDFFNDEMFKILDEEE
jgi:DNA-binding Xre family transcriptional regulator